MSSKRMPLHPAPALALLLALAAAVPAPAQIKPDLPSEEERVAGETIYAKWCSQCHGDTGAGDGPAAPFLRPEPRDFTAGKYKFRTTPFGTLPTDEDLTRAIVDGLPGTGMPAFPNLDDGQVAQVVDYLKTLSPRWENENAYAEPIAIPDPPAFDGSAEAIEEGRQVYERIGCARCHGEFGRGDGRSAPTLRNDWGYFVRPADLTKPWLFRGGAEPEDVYRTLTTGISGTPMAGFESGVDEADRWKIVEWILSHAPGDTLDNPYNRLVRSVAAEGEISLEGGIEAARELFAGAPAARFPLVGQIIQPGRDFHPPVHDVEVRAIHNRDEIALLLTWHDMSAERSGTNGPDLPVPRYEEREAGPGISGALGDWPPGSSGAGSDDDPFAADEADPFAADEAADPFAGDVAAQDPFAGDVAADDPFAGDVASDDPFAADTAGGAPGAAAGAAAGAPASEFSDAVAIQFPSGTSDGIRKPYFLFGDAQYPVELWFLDLAAGEPLVYEARGRDTITLSDQRVPEAVAGYADGEWAVVFKRRRTGAGVTFAEEAFLPIAFSVWDGWERERGNRRALTSWYSLYLDPIEAPSPLGPILRTALVVLGAELLIIALVRRRRRRREAAAPPPAGATEGATARSST